MANVLFSEDFQQSVAQVVKMAGQLNHSEIRLEHLLYASLLDIDGYDIAMNCSVDVDKMKQELEVYLGSVVKQDKKEGVNIKYSKSAADVFRNIEHIQIQSQEYQVNKEMTAQDIVLSILQKYSAPGTPGYLGGLLNKNGFDYDEASNYVDFGVTKNSDPWHGEDNALDADEESSQQDQEQEAEEGNDKGKNAVEKYCVNLNKQAEKGKFHDLIGRDEELTRVVTTLGRKLKNNPVLVGDPGVGKTVIVEGLAKMIEDNKAPSDLADKTIYSLDMGSLVAGTKYRGDFEKRLKSVIDKISDDPAAILFIDEVHNIIGAGAASGGNMDAANLLKPALARGDLKCIGATTLDEYRKIFEKDAALARRFQKVDVKEPSPQDTIKILQGIKGSFEEHHGVTYSEDAINKAVALSVKYLPARNLPDKAVDIIDEAGSVYKDKGSQSGGNYVSGHIGGAEIEEIVSQLSGIPVNEIGQEEKQKLLGLDQELKNFIYGQDEAVDAVASAVKMGRAGLDHDEKPTASFLFAGPTGVGKTELTRQLSKSLGMKLVRLDMSEYMEKHAVARLVGAPPGYVGYEGGGQLTEAVNKNPHSIVLLDEIEKAHPDVYNTLLQVMDHGTLTDSQGRKVDFSNSILIMTTNKGAAKGEKPSMGFAEQDNKTDEMKEIKDHFTPEFRNRLDGVVQFSPLGQNEVKQVVGKFISELEAKLDEKSIAIEFNDEARDWLVTKGFDPKMGARPMERVIKDHVKKPLSDSIISDEVVAGDTVLVSVEGDKLAISFDKASTESNAEEENKKPRITIKEKAPTGP